MRHPPGPGHPAAVIRQAGRGILRSRSLRLRQPAPVGRFAPIACAARRPPVQSGNLRRALLWNTGTGAALRADRQNQLPAQILAQIPPVECGTRLGKVNRQRVDPDIRRRIAERAQGLLDGRQKIGEDAGRKLFGIGRAGETGMKAELEHRFADPVGCYERVAGALRCSAHCPEPSHKNARSAAQA